MYIYISVRHILVTAILAGLVTLGFTYAPETISGTDTDSIDVTENIRLYSDGRLIGEWEGIGKGRMDGETYIFKTARGQFSNEYRIKGDFVIERLPN